MSLAPGARLGPYSIVAPLGEGGMGEVYRARDPRLDREVAIKVLPARLADDPAALARFEREAKAVATLSHPAILAIFDVGSADGVSYAVTELLDGETLRDRLAKGPLPARKAVDYAIQIAQGLGAAHEKGIVHRDLKPENLFLTNDGRAKILDFGLARQTLVPQAEERSSPTVSRHTEPGTVLGTVGYMSPEQVRGLAADPRSDIFSFGAVLYEMLSGRRAFKGETAAETMHAILKEEPADLTETSRNLAPALERIVHHCLEKQPDQRFHSAHDMAFDLQAVSATSSSVRGRGPIGGARSRRGLLLAGSLVAAAVLGALGDRALLGRPAEAPSYQRLTFGRGNVGTARLAPDGETVVYGAAWRGEPTEVFATRLDSRESRPLGFPASVLYAVSSKSELAVGLAATTAGLGAPATLGRVPLAGGAPREVLANVNVADWSPDGAELAAVVTRGDTEYVEFPIGKLLYQSKGEITHLRLSPRGDSLAFIEHPPTSFLSAGAVVVVDRGANARVLSKDWVDLYGLAWSPQGREVWFTGTRKSGDFKSLYAVTLDGKERLVSRMLGQVDLQDIGGDGRVLLTRVTFGGELLGRSRRAAIERDLTWLGNSNVADISDDADRVLFTEMPEGGAAGGLSYLRKMDGSPAVRLGEGTAFALSPNGKWALARRDSPSRLVLLPTGVGEAKTLPGEGLTHLAASWFPDGRRIVFTAGSGEGTHCYVQSLDGGPPRAISKLEIVTDRVTPVTPDGRGVLVQGTAGFLILPVEGGEPATVSSLDPTDEPIRFSQDGSAIYVSRPQLVTRQVFRVVLKSGQRKLLWELGARDPAGVEAPTAVAVPADGDAYAYSFLRTLNELYLVDGLK